ncbi:S-adenosyl-L-methionine-dependent methyltransferase [Entophlyctis helioformis]|nr:S-adenosyl-L-methionine-dependent methyltransferase [Entophlyctis helioformis]
MGKRGGRRARRGGNNGGGRGATGSNRQAVAGVDARDAPNAGSNGQVPYESYQVVLENKSFEDYYKNIVPSDQWDDFMASLRKPLPVSFRFTGSRNHAQDLREYMKKEYFPKLKGFAIEGEEVQPPEPVPWYPNDLAWVFDCGRTALRKSPQVNDFHRFLVSETEVGNISRQEVVSMVPVFFLDVKPGHKVGLGLLITLHCDRCAAPGSKTAQLLEAVHANENETAGESMPDGLVVANDSDYDRAMMLVHQAKRLQSPCLLVTNHEGQEFPRIFLSDRESEKGSTVLQFDRILCDVPCSGDGTLRKNKTIWRSYSIGNGNGLHRIQKSVLLRGCELLKVGGRLVYSTCTFNPIENEAVLASIINETNGAFRLVDASDILPDLVRHKGLSTWKPHDKSGKPLEAYDPSNPAIQESFFPPSNAATLGLEHCMRIYPLPQNGGGFFVAVLEKTGPYGALDRFSVFGGEYQPTEAEKLAAKAKAEAEADAEAQAKADGAATDKAPAKRPSEDNIR